MRELRLLADRGRTVVVVTHSVLHLDLCDRVLVMCLGGRMGYFGPPDELLAFFGAEDYADVFDKVTNDAERWAQRYRNSDIYRRYVGEVALELARHAAATARDAADAPSAVEPPRRRPPRGGDRGRAAVAAAEAVPCRPVRHPRRATAAAAARVRAVRDDAHHAAGDRRPCSSRPRRPDAGPRRPATPPLRCAARRRGRRPQAEVRGAGWTGWRRSCFRDPSRRPRPAPQASLPRLRCTPPRRRPRACRSSR